MLKKMQRRFIFAAGAAFATVMVLLIAGINIANYINTTANEDEIIERLFQFEDSEGGPAPRGFPKDMPGLGPEAEHTTRFFIVERMDNGEYRVLSKDFIATVDESTAKEYAMELFATGKKKGYYGEFRYNVFDNIIVLLNVSPNLHSIKMLLLLSVFIGIISFVVVLLLVVVFSRYAIKPFARNIARQKQFITDASHELKTPITSISTSADIIALEYEEDEWITNIQNQISRMTKLVGDLVALSRLDEESPFPVKEEFSLSDSIWEISDGFKLLATGKNKLYRADIEENLLYYGNRDAIQKMVSILLDNAVKYSDENGQIVLRVYSKRKRRIIEVENTCEISDTSNLDKVFDRFYRLDSSHSVKTGGTGIGLSIAQAVAEGHEGSISVSSDDGKHILFRVKL